ncbi:MFS transporter [Shimazuella sp. AN120528]|uniref:MFS transporter n=1 Tax=Shimazuella soli TaxID=1892854 RepID=UPI001F0D17BF|nr:MFS transporter [Shimazuella soli]MCH5586660.1 MFS transporter [Shimazuella soli]
MQNVWKLRFFCFFQSFIPAYVIERLFWEQRGVTVQQVIYTEILYALTILILEIPTGVLADLWGRKKMLVVGALLCCFEFFLLIYATQFWHFVIVVILTGVSYSFQSGSENALLYESLQERRQEYLFEKEIGMMEVSQLIGAILGALSGSWLANTHPLEINYWISFVSSLVAFGVSCLFIEPKVTRSTSLPPSIWVYTKSSLLFFRSKPHVLVIISAGMVLGASLNFIHEFWQLYLSELQIPIAYFGLFSASCMLLQIPGYLFVPLMQKHFHPTSILIFIQTIFIFGFAYISLVHHITSLIVFGLLFLVSGMVVPLVSGYLHHRIDANMRATIDSFQSLGTNIAVMGIGLGFGHFTSASNIFGGFGFIACFCFLFLFVFSFATLKNRR